MLGEGDQGSALCREVFDSLLTKDKETADHYRCRPGCCQLGQRGAN